MTVSADNLVIAGALSSKASVWSRPRITPPSNLATVTNTGLPKSWLRLIQIVRGPRVLKSFVVRWPVTGL